MGKTRVRLTSRGWLRLWLTFNTGRKDMYTGVTLPDEFGLFERQVWCGPFKTFEEAVKWNL